MDENQDELQQDLPADAMQDDQPADSPGGEEAAADADESTSLSDRLEQELETLRKDESEEGEPKVEDEAGEAAAATPDAKPDVKADTDAPPVEDRDPDDILAEGMKEKTRERFNELRSQLKEANDRIEMVNTGKQELHNIILESKATPQQLSGALQIFHDINSGNVEGAKRALGELQQLYDAVAQVAGESPIGTDLLEQHPDLQKAVEDLDVTKERAEEIARLRAQQAAMQATTQQQLQAQQSQREMSAVAQQAAAGIKQWEDGLLKQDPDFSVIQPELIKRFQAIRQQFPPQQWLPALQNAYQDIHDGLVLANKMQQQNAPAPIRPDASGGSMKADTSKMSLEEVMNASLANMRG